MASLPAAMIANLNRCGVQLMSQPFLQILKLPYPSPAFAPKMQSYTILRERRGPEELQRLLPEDMFLRLESAVLEVSSGSCLDSGHWLFISSIIAGYCIAGLLLIFSLLSFHRHLETTNARLRPKGCAGPNSGTFRARDLHEVRGAVCWRPSPLVLLWSTRLWSALAA